MLNLHLYANYFPKIFSFILLAKEIHFHPTRIQVHSTKFVPIYQSKILKLTQQIYMWYKLRILGCSFACIQITAFAFSPGWKFHRQSIWFWNMVMFKIIKNQYQQDLKHFFLTRAIYSFSLYKAPRISSRTGRPGQYIREQKTVVSQMSRQISHCINITHCCGGFAKKSREKDHLTHWTGRPVMIMESAPSLDAPCKTESSGVKNLGLKQLAKTDEISMINSENWAWMNLRKNPFSSKTGFVWTAVSR